VLCDEQSWAARWYRSYIDHLPSDTNSATANAGRVIPDVWVRIFPVNEAGLSG